MVAIQNAATAPIYDIPEHPLVVFKREPNEILFLGFQGISAHSTFTRDTMKKEFRDWASALLGNICYRRHDTKQTLGDMGSLWLSKQHLMMVVIQSTATAPRVQERFARDVGAPIWMGGTRKPWKPNTETCGGLSV